jgi:hypothetical protein
MAPVNVAFLGGVRIQLRIGTDEKYRQSYIRFADDRTWWELMGVISTHQSLRTLAFNIILEEDGYPSPSVKRDRTKAIADMLLTNRQVDEISFDYHTFDEALWNMLVTPRIECNIYRKRFVPLQMIGVSSTRAVLVASALARVTWNPSLVWMLLSQRTMMFFAVTWTKLSSCATRSLGSVVHSLVFAMLLAESVHSL